MSQKRLLTYEELVELADNLSDIEYLSDENDEFTDRDTPVEQESDNIEDDVNLDVETPLIESKKIKLTNFMKENDLTNKKKIKWRKNVKCLTPEYLQMEGKAAK
ncbi:uncharacterized protein [Leptinotarsa decemlineata]|uniref:uncharacterized protein n=1 Tax=Leptinotarsa decemlineata TaxID=7539 RepID=UPI003D30A65A